MAAEAGASAALVSQPVDSAIPALQVDDTLVALGQLGALNRQSFDGLLVGITGSCGKTSVKNMLAAILATAGSTLAKARTSSSSACTTARTSACATS